MDRPERLRWRLVTHGKLQAAGIGGLVPDYDHRKGFMVRTNTKTAVPAGCSLDAMSRRTRLEPLRPSSAPANSPGPELISRPSTTPAYYQGRPASVWLAAFGAQACAPRPKLAPRSVR